MNHKGSITLFLGAGASVCESFPTVFQFFERVKFPDGADARGFHTACQELARRIAVAERTQENSQWPRFDAEKLWGNLQLLVNSNKLTSVPFGPPVTHTGLSPQIKLRRHSRVFLKKMLEARPAKARFYGKLSDGWRPVQIRLNQLNCGSNPDVHLRVLRLDEAL
ncbi:MAG: hypothetical protein ACRD11_16700 [Terriglobia bacterium]